MAKEALPSSTCCQTSVLSTVDVVSHYLCFVLMICLFKMVPELTAKVLSSVPTCKKAVMYFIRKRVLLDKHVRPELQCCWL